jgi:hypothetical protein
MTEAAALSQVDPFSGFAPVLLPICYRFSAPDRFPRSAHSRRWARVRARARRGDRSLSRPHPVLVGGRRAGRASPGGTARSRSGDRVVEVP